MKHIRYIFFFRVMLKQLSPYWKENCQAFKHIWYILFFFWHNGKTVEPYWKENCQAIKHIFLYFLFLFRIMIKQLNPIEKEIARRSSTSGTYSFSFQGSNKKTKNLRSGLPKVLTLHMYIFCLFFCMYLNCHRLQLNLLLCTISNIWPTISDREWRMSNQRLIIDVWPWNVRESSKKATKKYFLSSPFSQWNNKFSVKRGEQLRHLCTQDRIRSGGWQS